VLFHTPVLVNTLSQNIKISKYQNIKISKYKNIKLEKYKKREIRKKHYNALEESKREQFQRHFQRNDVFKGTFLDNVHFFHAKYEQPKIMLSLKKKRIPPSLEYYSHGVGKLKYVKATVILS